MRQTGFAISWLGIIAIAALIYVIIRGAANPRTRPVVLGLFLCGGLMLLFYVGSRSPSVRVTEMTMPRPIEAGSYKMTTVPAMPVPGFPQVPPFPAPPGYLPDGSIPPVPGYPPAPQYSKSPAHITSPTKVPVITALRDALVKAWTVRNKPTSVTVTAVPAAPSAVAAAAAPAKPKANQAEARVVSPQRERPDWVNAAPRMEDDGYRLSVHSGPYTTPLECARELPKALQSAITEYADLSLGSEVAGVRLSDDSLEQFIKQRWTETRPMEIDGTNQDMVTLHALVVFDDRTKQLLKNEAERRVIDKRVQGAGVVFGGVLGLLAMTWGGLRLATKRHDPVKA